METTRRTGSFSYIVFIPSRYSDKGAMADDEERGGESGKAQKGAGGGLERIAGSELASRGARSERVLAVSLRKACES